MSGHDCATAVHIKEAVKQRDTSLGGDMWEKITGMCVHRFGPYKVHNIRTKGTFMIIMSSSRHDRIYGDQKILHNFAIVGGDLIG